MPSALTGAGVSWTAIVAAAGGGVVASAGAGVSWTAAVAAAGGVVVAAAGAGVSWTAAVGVVVSLCEMVNTAVAVATNDSSAKLIVNLSMRISPHDWEQASFRSGQSPSVEETGRRFVTWTGQLVRMQFE